MKQMVFLCLLSFISPLNLFFPPTLRVSLILPLFHPSLFPLLGPFFTVPIFKVSLVFSLFIAPSLPSEAFWRETFPHFCC